MQPLIIVQSKIIPFDLPFLRVFTFAGNTLTGRSGFYLEITTADGWTAKGEVAPLPGMSEETLKKSKYDLQDFLLFLSGRHLPLEKDALILSIREDNRLSLCCPSVRFGVESVLFSLAARANRLSLAQFLEARASEALSAVLLQGTHEQVIAQAKQMRAKGHTVFKLKVGDRNIPLDVKKVQDLRAAIGQDALIRLDANRVWHLSEALLFAQLVGNSQIEFIEEPLSDMGRLNEFYQATHMPVALDETLSVMRPGVSTPARCSPTLACSEGVKAYVIKPMVLGGIVIALDWIEEARRWGKKAVISSSFESPVGLTVLNALACLTGQTAGLGTQGWFNDEQ